VLQKLASFIFSKTKEEVFLLKGFAGTGKTTLIGTLVNSLWKTRRKSVLMAPTGRAAKVMSNYSKTQAFTIHRKIYFPKKQSGGGVQFVLAPNKHRDTIFIVDEASMIPDRPADSKLFGDKLSLNYNKEVVRLELDEVVRQAKDSGILANATLLREQLEGD